MHSWNHCDSLREQSDFEKLTPRLQQSQKAGAGRFDDYVQHETF